MTELRPGWSKAARRRRPGPRCDNCGRGRAVHRRVDSSGVPGRVCDTCDREPDEALSFG